MSQVRFLGVGYGFEEITLEVAYVAEFPRGADNLCAFCHGDPCAERSSAESDIARFYAQNRWANTCPVCAGRPS